MNDQTNYPSLINKSQLADLIQYKNNSIVSRQLIKKLNGNITLFAFDKSETLSEHTTPFDAFVFIVEGEIEISIGGTPYKLKGNEQIIMPANIPHGLKAISRTKLLLVMIK